MRSSSDVVSNYRLITWRVVDSGPGFKISGFSATGVLNYLDYADDYDYDYDYDHELENGEFDHDRDVGFDGFYDHEIEEIDGYDDDCNRGVANVDYSEDDYDDDDDDRMSFCEVGFVWQAVDGDESWCLVEEI